MKYVILGNGIAGVQAAETIRAQDPRGAITLIAGETFPPYCRPMISMVLEGACRPDQLSIRPKAFYENLRITPVTGRRAVGVDVKNRTVRIASGDGAPSEAVCYDRLLIATGADPRPVKAPGADLAHIFHMRTEAHVAGMLAALPHVKKALVLGGGLVGFKAAYGLLRRGILVTLLIRSGYPLSMQADETAGRMILEELTARGLDVRVGTEVAAFEGGGRVRQAVLGDGRTLPCDLAVIGKGVRPALSFVPKNEIETDLGVLVNAHMETSAPGVYAAGDVAEFMDVARGVRWVNAIWPEAVAQGRIAGMNMAGRPVAYRGSLSRNAIRMFNMDIMTAGIVEPPENQGYEVIAETSSRRRTYRKLVFRGDRLAGMVLVNRIEQGGLLMNLIHSRRPVAGDKSALLSPSFNYARIMTS